MKNILFAVMILVFAGQLFAAPKDVSLRDVIDSVTINGAKSHQTVDASDRVTSKTTAKAGAEVGNAAVKTTYAYEDDDTNFTTVKEAVDYWEEPSMDLAIEAKADINAAVVSAVAHGGTPETSGIIALKEPNNLESFIKLVNEMAVDVNAHVLNSTVHETIGDCTASYIVDLLNPTTFGSAMALLNRVKSDWNTHDAEDDDCHGTASGHQISTADATSQEQ